MAEFIINHAFRFATFTLNFLSPSIIADIVLHPFDFATVLLQIGFDPEGLKNEATTLASSLAQYALFTFYIPYLFTSMQGVQFMGLPHPSMFYYVTYIYNKEGILGCYRGILPKLCERIIMMYVNETVKHSLSGVPVQRSRTMNTGELDDDKFMQTLINSLCSQFFAVMASHPFHVIMVSSFAEFTYEGNSSLYKLAQMIYDVDGWYGFFIGMAPRLVGELFSMTFSIIYTGLVNGQIRTSPENTTFQQTGNSETSSVVSYLTEVSRFNVFKPRGEEKKRKLWKEESRKSQCLAFFSQALGNFAQNQPTRDLRRSDNQRTQNVNQNGRLNTFINSLPLTQKVFYYSMIRDYISKKISYPFFLVCNCMIVTDSGWDKLPFKPCLGLIIKLMNAIQPKKRCD